MSMGLSSATVVYNPNANQIVVYDLSEVTLDHIYKEINNETIISHDNRIWYLNASLRIPYGSVMYINDSSVAELRISNYKENLGLYDGKYLIKNVTIGSWDHEKSRYAKKDEKQVGISTNQGIIQNLNLKGLKYIGINKVSEDVYNISAVDCYKGLIINNATGKKIYNVSIENVSESAIYCFGCIDTDIYNIYIKDAGNYLTPATGCYGIVYDQYSANSSMHDIFINGSGWSAIGSTVGSSNIHIYNVTVYNAGHNGIDIHGGHDVFVKNASIYNSVSNNILVTLTENVTFENIYSYRATGNSIQAGYKTFNITFINITSVENRGGHSFFDIRDVKLINITSNNGSSVTFTKTSDVDVINGTIVDTEVKYPGKIELSYSTNSKLINVLSQILFYPGRINEGTIYYYSDVWVKNNSNTSVSNAKIYFTNEKNSSYSSVNGWGEDVSSFYTTPKGHTQLPNEDRKNSPAIAEYYKNSKGVLLNLSYTATIITPDNRTVSLTGITPDSSWYRKDPNNPAYTITAIIPDNSTGPHITGFAPVEDNPFNPGEKKNFRIWTDEPLTSMEWLVNGLSVSKGSLNYTWPITEGNHTIKFIGSNVNGTVNKTWYLGGSYDEPLVPGGNPTQEIEFSPADSVLTKNVSETVDFSVSPDIFTTKEWYVDGDLVLNNTVSMSKRWSTSGTYNVTFSGSGSEDVLHTWTVNVIEEPKDDEVQNKSIITIAPEYQIIEPKKSFDLSIKVEPRIPISGTQLDFVFNSSKTSVNNVTEGDLLKQSGAYTIFSSGTINNIDGKVKNIYGFILGTSNVSSPGTMAIVNLTAGNRTGMANFSLSNVLISDANSKSVPYTVTNATVLIDTSPVINPICYANSVDEKSTLTFKVSAKDADGDKLILSASGLPGGASFNKTSGAFTWTPAVGQAGVYTLTFKVSDGYLTDSENVTVTVNKLNNPPVINSFEPLNGSSFSEGERIGISVNASDADGQALTYFIRIDGVTHSTDPAYIWETDYSTSGNHTIEVVVSDGTEEVKGQRIIYISECQPRWDVNEDGVVNILDITSVSQMVGSTLSKPYPRYDVNQDGLVNIQDLTLVGNHFGEIVN